MSLSKSSFVTVFSLVARGFMVVAFTLPVLSLYGEGEAQPISIATSVLKETASVHTSSGNYRIDMLSRAIEKYPNNAALYNSRGWYSFVEGLYEQSVNDYNAVIELGIEGIDETYHASVYHVRGLGYAALSEYALAVESLKVAMEIYESQGNVAAVEELTGVIEEIESR